MIQKDYSDQSEKDIALTEYLASFWNPEAVKNIQESRASRELHNFKSDKEFEKDILSGDYKNNPYIDLIKSINKKEEKSIPRPGPKSKLPTDLSAIQSIIKGKFK